MKQGETFSRSYVLSQDDGTPVDLTGYVIRSSVSRGAATVALTVAVPSPLTGGFDLSAASGVTATWELGKWKHDVRIQDPLGVVVYTETQTFDVLPAVTPNAP